MPGPGTAWYTGVVENGAQWVEPYFGAAGQEWFIDYGVPFYWTEGERAGQVRGMIDLTLQAEDFRNYLHARTVGKATYEFMATASGAIVTHPVADFVGNESLDSLIAMEEQSVLKQAFAAIKAGEQDLVTYRDNESGSRMIFVYDVMETSGYRFGLTFDTTDMVGSASQPSRRIINIAIAFSIFS